MIPKVIHYCWFGRNPLPKSAIKCIESWKKYLPDYEIKEWNEDNFDVNIIPYTKEAYEAKKYAFVSDYARFWILYHYGGLYFDTDVEVIRNIAKIIQNGPYMGCELTDGTINPGLGIAATSHMHLYKRILENYLTMSFWDDNGNQNNYSMIPMVTNLLRSEGLKQQNVVQNMKGITIYPTDYCNPYDYLTGRLNMTENTFSIHWYTASWMKQEANWRRKIKQYIRRLIVLIK